MSLILDALRKADHDRKIEDNPASIEEIYQNDGEAHAASDKPGKIVVGSVVLGFVLIGAFLIFNTFGKSSNESASTQTERTAVANAPEPIQQSTNASATDKASEPKPVPTTTPTSTPAKKHVSATTLRNAQVQKQYLNPNNSEVTPSETQSKISALYKDDNPEPVQPVNIAQNQSKLVETKRDTIEPVDPNTLSAYQSVPLIKELLPSEQKAIPTMMYTEHRYSEGERNSVVIGGKRLYEGSAPAQGLKIHRILKDGIIVTHNQKEFKMPAMNSWINF